MPIVTVGLVGFGTVGAAVAEMLLRRGEEIRTRTGAEIRLKRIVDTDLRRRRPIKLPRGMLASDSELVLDDPEINVVVELVGGTEAARDIVTRALKRGKNVVTANKALVAGYGRELIRVACKAGATISFEGSVAGGIPIIGALQDGLVANRITGIRGIVNGTCNYILTKMEEDGASYKQALADAQRRGYAERDPSLDVDGTDTVHKLAILARVAFAADFDHRRIFQEGITHVETSDIEYARELGYRVKLLAIGKLDGNELELRVHPTLVPLSDPLAAISGVFNAIAIEGEPAGQTMFYGAGAGGRPTSSAVVSDLVDLALGKAQRRFQALSIYRKGLRRLKVRRMGEIESRYYLRCLAIDRPGVLAQVASLLGQHQISILSVIQKGRSTGGPVPVVFMTHPAREGDLQKALGKIEHLPVIKGKTTCIRAESTSS